jgi:zinc transporter ZupT
MIWINKAHIIIALGATLFLMLFHYFSPWVAQRFSGSSTSFTSFAGGVAVAYVFLHMLPNLVEYNKPIGEYLLSHQWLTPFMELFIYIIALTGFLIYYGLDILAQHYHKQRSNSHLIYNLHLFMFGLYNFLITYTMALRAVESYTATILFSIAMALNFLITDRKFCRLYHKQFNQRGRFLLIGALFVGWLFTVIFDPANIIVIAFMVAFLAGSVLLNVFREKLPATGSVSYWWFIVGVLLITCILLLQTWIIG